MWQLNVILGMALLFAAFIGGLLAWAWITDKIRKFRIRNHVNLYLTRKQMEILVRSGLVTGYTLPQATDEPQGGYQMTVGRGAASKIAERFKERFIEIWREMGAQGTPFDTIDLTSPEPDKLLERIDCWMAVKGIEMALAQNQATGFGSEKLSVNLPKEGRVFITIDEHPESLQLNSTKPTVPN